MHESLTPIIHFIRGEKPWNPLRLFSRRWILATLLVIAAMGVMVRLGIWQLNRLAQRRAFNARVTSQIDRPALVLGASTLDENLTGMEYRQVVVYGVYDFSQQVALRNQVYRNEWGVHLITPLKIEGTDQAILVDRGWIPSEDYQSGNWDKYDVTGGVKVQGAIRLAQTKPDFGQRSDPTLEPGQTRLDTWNFVNVGRIAEQTPYTLLPVYIQQAPDPASTDLPYGSVSQFDLSEGPHMGYAIQWFTFALMLGVGYPFLVRSKDLKPEHEAGSASQE
jgi:surfeit locus 1 family protein